MEFPSGLGVEQVTHDFRHVGTLHAVTSTPALGWVSPSCQISAVRMACMTRPTALRSSGSTMSMRILRMARM